MNHAGHHSTGTADLRVDGTKGSRGMCLWKELLSCFLPREILPYNEL